MPGLVDMTLSCVSAPEAKTRTLSPSRLKSLLPRAGSVRALAKSGLQSLQTSLARRGSVRRKTFLNIWELLLDVFADHRLILPSKALAALSLLWDAQPPPPHRPLRWDRSLDMAWRTLPRAQRFIHYAEAVYGATYSVGRLLSHPGQLVGLVDTAVRRLGWPKDVEIVGDPGLLNTAAFLYGVPEPKPRLHFVSYRNEVVRMVPFVVATDPETGALVVACRGTLSLGDAITDLDATPTELFDGPGCSRMRAHGGMLSVARWLADELLRDDRLPKLLSSGGHPELVVTGHSLGAGVAALLTLLLEARLDGSVPVRCFAFSPPGCMLNDAALDASRRHTLSFVLRDDCVPRVSLESLQDLRTQVHEKVQEELWTSGQYRVLATAALHEMGKLLRGLLSPSKVLAVPRAFLSLPMSLLSVARLPLAQLRKLQDWAVLHSSRIVDRGLDFPDFAFSSAPAMVDLELPSEVLYAPGLLLHMVPRDGDGGAFHALWTDTAYFKRLRLSDSLLDDHMAYNVKHHILALTELPQPPMI